MDATTTDAKVGCGVQTHFTPGMSLKGLVKVSDRADADRKKPYSQAKDISLMLPSLLFAQVLNLHGLTYFLNLFLIQEKCSWTLALQGTEETLLKTLDLLAQHAQADYF